MNDHIVRDRTIRTDPTSAYLRQVESQPCEDFTRYIDTNRTSIELDENGLFYILVLGQQHIRFLRGTRDTIELIKLEGAPQNMCEVIGEQLADVETYKSALHVRNQEKGFGSSTPSNWQRNRLLRYSRMVNWAVHKFLVGNQSPLIVAGTEFQCSIYHKVNTYPHLLDQDIVCNVERLADENFQHLAWEIVAPLFRQTWEQTLDGFRQQVSSGLTSMQSKLDAYYGWDDPVIITEESQPSGIFYPKTARFQHSNEQSLMSARLVTKAAAQATLNGSPQYALHIISVIRFTDGVSGELGHE